MAKDPADCTRYNPEMSQEAIDAVTPEQAAFEAAEYEAYQAALQGTPQYWSELCNGDILYYCEEYRDCLHAEHKFDGHISGTINNAK